MSEIIEFEVLHNPKNEPLGNGYHYISILEKKLHLVQIPTELAEYLPPWSIIRIKKAENRNSFVDELSKVCHAISHEPPFAQYDQAPLENSSTEQNQNN